MEQLDQLVTQKVSQRDALLSSSQTSEKRLSEIGTLKKHIINYSKTRKTYEEYRKAGYSKKFLEAHREEITLHKAAKAAFDELGVKKLPKVKELSAEYAEILATKKQAYAEYRKRPDLEGHFDDRKYGGGNCDARAHDDDSAYKSDDESRIYGGMDLAVVALAYEPCNHDV